jgi:ankyrin repeat protein
MSDTKSAALSTDDSDKIVSNLRVCISNGDVSGVAAILGEYNYSDIILSANGIAESQLKVGNHASTSPSIFHHILDCCDHAIMSCQSTLDIASATVASAATVTRACHMLQLLLADSRIDKELIDQPYYYKHYHNGPHSQESDKQWHCHCHDHHDIESEYDNHGPGSVCGHWTVLARAARCGYTSIVEMLLADWRVDKASIDMHDDCGHRALDLAARNGHISVLALLLADSRVDSASIEQEDFYGLPVLVHAASSMHRRDSAIYTLISNGKTTFAYLIDCLHSALAFVQDIRLMLCAELTRRQMCVIYPPRNRQLWPNPVHVASVSSTITDQCPSPDSCSAAAVGDCALLSTSFFQSSLFDLNVIGIIREYVILSSWTPYSSPDPVCSINPLPETETDNPPHSAACLAETTSGTTCAMNATEIASKLRVCINNGDISGVTAILSEFRICDMLSRELLHRASILHSVLQWCEEATNLHRLQCRQQLRQLPLTHINESADVVVVPSESLDSHSENIAMRMLQLLLSDLPHVDKQLIDQHCLAHCVDPRESDPQGELLEMTILSRAVHAGYAAIVKLLLDDSRVDKASIDCQDEDGWTALMRAASNGHVHIVEMLLADSRVDHKSIDIQDMYGWTTLMHASFNGHTAIVELLLGDSRVDKTSIDMKDGSGSSVLMCVGDHIDVLKVFLADSRVDKSLMNLPDFRGRTILMRAAAHGWVSVVELLLSDYRVDSISANQTDDNGSTALSLALLYSHEAVVDALMSNLKTAFVTIAHCLEEYSSELTAGVRSMLCEEITRRQMCVIYPPRNPLSVASVDQTDGVIHCCDMSVSGMSLIAVADTKLNDTMTQDHDINAGGAAAAAADHCALVSSFFESTCLFDVNLLRVIREYC